MVSALWWLVLTGLLLIFLFLYRRRWRNALKTLRQSREALLRLYNNYDKAGAFAPGEDDAASSERGPSGVG